jgi:hypothetical protein
VRIVVAPDDYYEGFYRARLGGRLPDAARAARSRAATQRGVEKSRAVGV